MNDDALKVIWSDNAQTDSSFTATYEEFKSAMNQSQDFRNAVYDGIRERDNKATATNQEWDKYLGFNSITNTNSVVDTEKPTVTTPKSTLRNEAYSTLSDDDLQGKYNDMLKKAEQRKKEAIEKAKNEQIALAKEKPLLHAISQIGQSTAKSPDLAKTPIELMEQQDVSWFLDENDKNEYNLLRNEIGVRGYESGYEGIKKSTEEEENRVKNIRANAELNGTKLTARDKNLLRKAEEINKDARELVEAGSKFGNESGVENWVDGLSNTLIDRDMIIGVGLIRDMKVDNMVEKLNNGEELSDAEGALLLAAYNFEEVAKTRSFDLSTGYKIGQSTAESIPFIVDMLLTKGLIGGGKTALLKFFASKGKDVAKLAKVMDVSLDVNKNASKLEKVMDAAYGGSKAAKTTGEKILHGAYELGETAVQTAMMPSSLRQMQQEKTEIRKETGENDISLLDNARIFGNAYVQTFTERQGGQLIDWGLGKMIPAGNLLARYGYKEGVMKSLNEIIQQPVSEVGEGYLEASINFLRSLDLFNLYADEWDEDMRKEALAQFSKEGFVETVGSTLPISLLGGAANAVSVKTATNRFNKSHIAFGKMLEEAGATNAQSENILAQIEHASSQEEFNERLEFAKGFLRKHIQETETDLGIANTKMKQVNEVIENYKNTATTFNNAIKDLRKLYSEMHQEKRDAMKADFDNMRRKLNESITTNQQQEGTAITHKKPTSGWQKRTMSVKIDGKNTKATFSGDVIFNEDGSINTNLTDMSKFRLQNDKGQNIITTVKGEEARQKLFDTYLNAVNNALRAEKTKRDEEIAEQQAAEEARKAELKRQQEEEKAKVDAENAKLEAEKQAIAQQEADRQNIIASFPKDKNGEVDIDKMSPEQFFVYESDTDTPEAAMNTVGDVLNDLYQQLEDNVNETNKEKRARNAAKIRNRIRQYESVVVKYAGQETLDKITAARAEALQPKIDTPPVEEGPAVPPVQAPAVAPLQDDVPAEPDTTPLQPAEPAQETIGDEGGVENEEDDEVTGQEREPIDLSSDDVVFVRQDWRVDIARRDENGELRFVDSGKKVGSSWRVMDNKFLVYYNGTPCYALTTVKDVKAFPNSVTIVAQDYTGNKLKVSKWTLKDAEGNKLLKTGAEIQEENIRNNYKSLDDFMNEVVYANPKTGIKLTLGELLAIPAVQTNKGQRGKPVYAFQVEQFLNKNASTEDRAEILRDIRHRISEIAGTWNAYVRINNLTDVVTEDNITDFYKSMKEAGGYKSNGLTIQTQDFWALNSNDITKNPILQMLVMLDQAKELGLFSGSISMMSVDKLSSIKQGISKASSMSTEDILREMEDIRKDRALKNDNSIASKRFNELGRELKKRTESTDNTDANVETTEERPATSANNDEAEMQLNNLATLRKTRNDAISAGDTAAANSIQALITTVEEELKAKGIEYPADVLPTTEQPAAQQTQNVDADSLREEYNRIQSDLNEFVYETDEDIDAANTRLAEIKEQLRSIGEFMVGDVVSEDAESTKRIIKILKAAGVRVVTFKNDELPKYVSKKKLEELSDGQIVYGFASNDTIYLNEDHFNPNAPLHEFTHLWVTAYKQAFPNEWKRFVEIANKSALAANLRKPLKDGKASPYAKLNADEMASEVLSRYTGYLYGELDAEGKTAFENMMQAQTMEEKIAEKSLLNRIRNIWKKIISWFDKSIEDEKKEDVIDDMIRQFAQLPMETLARGKEAVDELMLNNMSENLDNSAKKETNFDKKFKKMQETLDKGGKNVLSLQEISELTDTLEDDLRQGNKPLVFERLPHGALQALLSEQRTLREAITIAALRSRRAARDVRRDGKAVTSDENTSRDASNLQMEFDVRSYAKANGLWIEDPIAYMNNKYGEDAYLADGQESKVWADESTGDVVKVKTTGLYETLEEFLEGIILNNWIFKENSQTIEGFGYLEDGTFAVVYRTPYVRVTEHNPLTQDEKDEFMALYGFVPIGKKEDEELKANGIDLPVVDYNNYTNGEFEIRDLHVDATKPNIVRDSSGRIQAIDPIIKWKRGEHYRLSTPDEIKRYKENESKLDAWVDNGTEFMIGPAIDAKQKAGIEKASNKLVKGIAANVPLPERMNELGKIWTEASDGGEVFRQLLKALREFNAKHGLGRKLPEGSDIRQVYTNSRSVLANKLRELTNLYEKPLRKNLEELIEIVKVSSMYDKYKKEMRTVEEEVIQDGKAVSVLKQIEHELTPREFIERYLIACDNIERYQNGIPTRGLAMFKQWMGVDVIEFQAEFEAAFGASKEGEALLKNLWKSINDYTNYTLEDSFACEMIKPEEYYRRKERKFYIPERDFAIDKDLEQPEVAPKKRYKSNKLSSSIKAKGGKSLAANIIENIFYIGNTDLQKNNKNRVKLAMWNLLQANPEFRASIGLPRPEEVWYDRDGKRVTNAPTREEREHMRLLQDEIFRLEYLLDEELSKEEALQDKKEIDSLNEELKKAYKEREDIPYMLEYEARHRFQSEGDPNLVGVYVNGTMCSMSFPNMSLAAIALNDAWDKSPNIWNPIRWIKGHISSVITAIEPAFFLKNVPTDGMSIILKGAVQYGWEFSLRYIATAKDILKHGKLVGTYVSGGDYRSLENGELFRDFLMNGGNTGYSSARSMDKILKELESLDRGHSSIKEAMEQSKKSLTFMNECTELLLRFAAYKTAIDMGKGVEEATNAANNLSANFNRRGERVPLSENVALHTKAIYGFIRMFKELSMFYNPAMQGAMQFFRMFGESGALDTKEKVERWASIVVNAMFIPALAGFLNAMMFRDDDKEEWSVTEYDRANYLVIGKNGRFAMGHMTRPFYNIGVNIALHMQGRRDSGKIADSILTSFLTHLTPCAPSLSNIGVKTVHSLFGGQELNLWDYLQSFTTPEALAVFNEAADGVNFMGQQIKYDDEKIAMHTKNPNAGVIEKVLAKMWFCVGGGEWDGVTTLKRKGEGDVHDMFNVTPNEVRTFLSLLMPKTFIDTGNVIAGAVQNVVDKERGEYIENNIKLKNIPFFNTFISERTPEAYRNGIYSEANKIARANKLVMDKAYKEMVRISVKMNNELSDEEYRDLEKRYEHFEAIYNKASGDVVAGAIREILPAYKEVRFSNLQKRFSMNEKELRKYLSDIDYDALEESERELIFNLSQLVQMKEGCGPINSKIPQWMKGVFSIEPTSVEVQELWDTYEEYIKE